MSGVHDVLFCGAWDEGPGYPRTSALRASLQQGGIVVHECRVAGLGSEKQRLLRSPWRWPAAWWRQRRQRSHLLRELRAACAQRRPDCIVVPYPGHALVRAIKAAVDVPVVLDLFLSAYDTVVEDRRLVAPGSLAARWLQRIDTAACAAADLVLLDTPANAAYVASLTGLSAEHFAWMPVSVPSPMLPAAWPGGGPALQVLFFGTGVPLHGLTTLVDAVARAPAVQLTLVGGTDQERHHAQQVLGARLTLEPKFVDEARLHELLATTQLVGGVFGSTGKTQRVVPFKLVHALAAGRPVLTAETPAVCGWLEGCGALFTVPAGDVEATAATLRELAADPSRVGTAAAAATAAYERHFSLQSLGDRWQQLLPRLIEVPAGAHA